jgi:hypothetical protein
MLTSPHDSSIVFNAIRDMQCLIGQSCVTGMTCETHALVGTTSVNSDGHVNLLAQNTYT